MVLYCENTYNQLYFKKTSGNFTVFPTNGLYQKYWFDHDQDLKEKELHKKIPSTVFKWFHSGLQYTFFIFSVRILLS